jgi:hypothetical protein
MVLTPSELKELMDSEPAPPAPRLNYYPFQAPPAFYECDCGARYSTFAALSDCQARAHK